VGNWKMNGSFALNASLLAGMKFRLGCSEQVDVVVCPPYPYLAQVRALLEGSEIFLGAQNLSSFSEGAYTGEVSASMLVDIGCSWVIVGHSERRNVFGETNQIVADKVRIALEHGLKPILCVGETLEQRVAGVDKQIVRAQLDEVVSALGGEHAEALVVAYEPVWAIGTGVAATPDQAEAMHIFIRSHLSYLGVANQGIKVLYGGSVNVGNASSLFSQPNIDGALVGGASLIVDDFSSICAAAAAS